jgi:site-specific DNA-cytosine methylase
MGKYLSIKINMEDLKNEGINVLSLFDGVCCAKLALEKAGIKVNKYYSSEIDKTALAIQNYHYGSDPNFIQLGDVRNINGHDLADEIDLIIFGSPCTQFSTINPKDRSGLQGPDSSLFYEALRILKGIYVMQPNNKRLFYLMENVASMRNVDRDKISDEFVNIFDETNLLKIDSALICPGHRRRYYWTNIPNADLPEPKDIKFKDILENGYVDRDKANVILTGNVTLTNGINRHYNMNIGNIIFKDKEFAELPNEEKLLQYPAILKESNYVGKSGSCPNELDFPNGCYRHPSIKEYSRIMTIPDDYIDEVPGVSKSEKLRAIGLAFSVDVVAHLLKNLNDVL